MPAAFLCALWGLQGLPRNVALHGSFWQACPLPFYRCNMRIPFISLAAAGALALGGCTYGGLGLGYGSDPYYGGGYGYGSPSGSYYGSPYYNSGYYGGLGYGYSPYGWYNNYYYPGSGYYVYDQYRRPRQMTISERQYWLMRARAASGRTGTTATGTTATTATPTRTVRQRENWSGFRSRAATRSSTTTVSEDDTTTTSSRRRNRARTGLPAVS